MPRPPGAVTHTLGWPLPRDAFGGSFIYPMGENLVSLGLVVGLDAPYVDLDVHALLQRFKRHPLLRQILAGGELVEWGAKTIPEGGYYAIPDRLSSDGLLIAGDAAGLVDVASLKGIQYAMRSGILAAEAIGRALAADDVSGARLSSYDAALRESLVTDAVYRNRNQRLAFKSGFFAGGVRAGLMQATGGTFPGRRIGSRSDADEPRAKRLGLAGAYDGAHSVAKVDAVFRSGNATRDDIPSHLVVGTRVSPEMADLYESLCPAEGLRAGRRPPGRERPELYRLQGDGRPRAALDAARRRERARVQGGCECGGGPGTARQPPEAERAAGLARRSSREKASATCSYPVRMRNAEFLPKLLAPRMKKPGSGLSSASGPSASSAIRQSAGPSPRAARRAAETPIGPREA